MDQFTKWGGPLALAALLATTPPVMARDRCRAGAGVSPAPCFEEAPCSYPVGYDGSSWTPTGNGVVYNIPPSPGWVTNSPLRLITRRGGIVSAAY